MENTLIFDGYTFDTETRKITFTQKVCWNCKGNTIVERGILCPRYGRKQAGKACEHCGSKSKDSHRVVGTKWVRCDTCDGTGMEQCDEFSSLDMSPLLQFINIVLFNGMRAATWNESYLGRGIIGGCTDYGRYLDEIGRDVTKMVEYARNESMERNSHTQALNLIDSNGCLIESAVVKMNDSGWTLFSIDAKSSVFRTE